VIDREIVSGGFVVEWPVTVFTFGSSRVIKTHMEVREVKKRARNLAILKTLEVHITYSREKGHSPIIKHILKAEE